MKPSFRLFLAPLLLGAALRAGTNCGSCIPELRKIIASEATRDAA